MSKAVDVERPVGPNYSTVTVEELVAYREAKNRFRASEAARAILGSLDPGATITGRKCRCPAANSPSGCIGPRPSAAARGSTCHS